MKKLFYVGALIAASLWSCRPEVNPVVKKPTADSFSPGIARTGDTVSVIGSSLKDSKILINGREVQIITNTDNILSFPVTNALTNPNALPKGEGESIYTLEVVFKDGSSTKFLQSILLNHIVRPQDLTWLASFTGDKTIDDTLGTGPAQLLITDFDGHGVRTAKATERFDQTQWAALVKTGGTQLITNNFLGVTSTKANGNFLATQLNPEFVENRTSGFVGEFVSATDVLNNREDAWATNFSEIPGSPIAVPKLNGSATDKTALNQTYLNFFLYKNNKVKGLVRPYLYNNLMEGSVAFAFNIPDEQGNGEWSLVSIPFRSMKTGYGSTDAMKFSLYSELNKMKFVFTHFDKKDEDKKTPDSGLKTAVDDVQFYLDHIIITQGSPYLIPPTN